MRARNPLLSLTVLGLLVPILSAPAPGDEGMWPLNRFPRERFAERHGTPPDRAWLDHVRLASVRFTNGGSGSFVSADGLVITNHHVGRDCIHKLSTAERDLIAEGFVAASPADELPCPDLELNVLVGIEPVTGRVHGATEGMPAAEAAAARRAERAAIERQCQEESGLRCDVVELYEGGEYDLYRYRRYTDVRLAFAPETQLAFFGGDPDNFEYPRFVVDVALFRVWEDGEPAAIEHHLAVDPTGPEAGEVTFVSGHPGSTDRLATTARLEWLRDIAYPSAVERFAYLRERLLAFSARGAEGRRIAADSLAGLENGLKARSGYLSGLLDEELMATKAAAEAELRSRVEADPELARRIGDPWREIEAAFDTYRTLYARRNVLENGFWPGELPGLARTIVRLAAERDKPDGERLPRYREAARPSLLQGLYSEAPIYPDYEIFNLTGTLERLRLQLGPTHPVVLEVLGDRSPEQVAREAVEGTKLARVAARRALVEGGQEAVVTSTDPMIRLMAAIDPAARAVQETYRDEVRAVQTRAGQRIAEATFAIHGTDTYPDATFSLRLTYGTVTGYQERGAEIPWQTTFRGLFERAERFGHRPPYDLPTALVAVRHKLDLSTPLDFVSTHDIIGGNSGSPIVDAELNVVGLIFDGNIEMLANRFLYTDEVPRAVSVHTQAIMESLTKIYEAERVVDELLGVQ